MSNHCEEINCLRQTLSFIEPPDTGFDLKAFLAIRPVFSRLLLKDSGNLNSFLHSQLSSDVEKRVSAAFVSLVNASSWGFRIIKGPFGMFPIQELRKALEVCLNLYENCAAASEESSPDKRSLTVFYTWQDDSDRSVNRVFLKGIIEKAIKEINKTKDYPFLLTIDHDTKGAVGAVNIVDTIARKISKASVFIADLTFVTKVGTTGIPNPNVMWEVGYAINALGNSRMVLMQNKAYFPDVSLPFDIAANRVFQYQLDSKDSKELKDKIAKQLQSDMVAVIRKIIDQDPDFPA